ncbi:MULTISPECIES: DUF6124 family protein [unclassified Pseudomonas]|uniref:DUF6124 family protein n=1 Tax=unclassified Pseudomonas TaxID=196821 RepID=UPI001CBCD332|nr:MULTISPECIES: DUF6124 family protein [unclassified Pseudomonas]
MTNATENPLDTDPDTRRQPSPFFFVSPDIDNVALLAYACESLASANVMASDFVRYLEGSHCNTLLGIQQSIMLGELAVNRVLENLDPP